MESAKKAIIGLGCDPNRAAFAKKMWEPKLNVEMDAAHSVKSLLEMVGSKRYEVFFIAPGMCSLLGAKGRKDL